MRFNTVIVMAVAASTFLAGLPLPASADHSYSTPRFGGHDHHDHDHGYGRRPAPVRMMRLGSVTTDRREYQNDVFEVRDRQRYTGIVFKVDRGDVAIDLIRVTFADDSSFLPETKIVFHEGERTCRIDFPGYNREIKRIRIRYQSLTRGVSIIDAYGIPAN